ncbi:MAG: TraB/GumN family protein [Allorhizobium sp.]
MNTATANDNSPSARRPRLGDVALAMVATVPLGLVVLLLVAFAWLMPAHAGEDATCGGKNLLTEMQTSNPSLYADVVREGAAMPNGHGILWKLEKPGIEPSYLLGTMHVSDPRVVLMPPLAGDRAAKASVIIIESDEILDDKKAAAALLSKPELSMFTDGTTIADYLSDEDEAKLDAGLSKRGIPLAAVARMRPWILSSFVALSPCELTRKAEGKSFLDKKIAEDAVAAGKPVKGLETLAEQLEAMAQLPVEFHLQALIETLALGDRMNDIMETMTELYLSGHIGMTMPMLRAVSPEDKGGDQSGYAAFEQRIILDRNKIMATRAAPLLDKGNAFMAVGALHLSGSEGLVELLRQQGFVVSAVN